MKREEDGLFKEIVCDCGRDLQLEHEGDQYQNRYSAECECGLRWQLIEYSEELEEVE